MTDIQELRAVAEAATPGPWRNRGHDLFADFRGFGEPYVGSVGEMDRAEDMAYVATFNPALVSLLLDVVEAARQYRRLATADMGTRILLGGQLDAALAALSDSAPETTP